MRRRFSVILPIIIMLLVAIICIIAYLFATEQIKIKTLPKKNIAQNVVSSNKEEVVLTKNELPRLDASVLTQPLMTSIVKDFTCSEDISNSILNYTDTDNAMKKLLNGEVDAVITTYPSDEVLSLAEAREIDLDIIPIAKEGFAFFTNRVNPVDSIKISDVQKIYIGEINNWNQVGGNNIDILAFQRPDNSISQMEMKRTVMKDLKMISAPKSVFTDLVYGEVNDLIANYNNPENGIGYSYYTEAKLLYDFEDTSDSSIKFLKINEIELTEETIKDGSYPFITNFYFIKDKNNESEHLQIFSDALLSDRGKNAIKEAGYINE